MIRFFPPKENMASCGIFIVLVSRKPLATLDVRNYALCTTQLCIRVKVSASRDPAFVKQVVFTKHVVCALQQAVMVSHPEPLIFALLTQWTQLEGCTGSKGPTYNVTSQHCTWNQNLQCNITTLYTETKTYKSWVTRARVHCRIWQSASTARWANPVSPKSSPTPCLYESFFRNSLLHLTCRG